MEGSIKAQKIQAMRNYKRAQFLYNFILYSLTSLITLLFFSYSFWSPSMKYLVLSLPNYISFPINSKCLFLVANLIVLLLIGESKLAQSSHSSPSPDIYDEYLARSRTSCSNISTSVVAKVKEEEGIIKNMNNIEDKKRGSIKKVNDEEMKKELRGCKSVHHSKQKKIGLRASKSEVWGESGIMEKRKSNYGEKEGQLYIHDKEELNKRVEAFIARVNKQRLLESKTRLS